MNIPWRTIIWQQFGAAIDDLGNSLRACPRRIVARPFVGKPLRAARVFSVLVSRLSRAILARPLPDRGRRRLCAPGSLRAD